MGGSSHRVLQAAPCWHACWPLTPAREAREGPNSSVLLLLQTPDLASFGAPILWPFPGPMSPPSMCSSSHCASLKSKAIPANQAELLNRSTSEDGLHGMPHWRTLQAWLKQLLLHHISLQSVFTWPGHSSRHRSSSCNLQASCMGLEACQNACSLNISFVVFDQIHIYMYKPTKSMYVNTS